MSFPGWVACWGAGEMVYAYVETNATPYPVLWHLSDTDLANLGQGPWGSR